MSNLDIIELLLDIKKELTEVKKELTEVKKELTEVKKEQEKQSTSTKDLDTRLSSHINFIDTTYDTLKNPLSFIKSRVETLMSIKTTKNIE